LPSIRFRGWRPAHGWAPFVTELIVVVLGVLIALGAQQAIDNWNTQRELDDFRLALNGELVDNLEAYSRRMQQGACLSRRLDALERWQEDWRDGDGPPLRGTIGRPLAYSLRMSVWRTGASSLATSMPIDERLAYADIYDALETYDGLRFRDVDTWQALFSYDGARQLSPVEVNQLRGLILSARSTDRSIRINWPGLQQMAAAIDITVPDVTEDESLSGLCSALETNSEQ
jgi:hypothetical protein